MEIVVDKLLMKYGQVPTLKIRSLKFSEGTAYGLVGHNGAGKTTLFKCMTNIITTYSGDISIDGTSVKENNEVLLNVGIVLDGMSCYTNRTGWFNIEYFAGLRGQFDSNRANSLAKELDLLEVLNQKVKTYSYGMQKKLILLIALMHTPKILILDEPFRGLDVETVKWFKKYLKQLIAEGLTLIISSHVQNDLEALCDMVYVIERGQIIDSINMNSERTKQMRLINTSDNQKLIEILEKINYFYEASDDGIKIDISDTRWKDIKNELVADDIEINELTKIKILEDKLN
ncbi:ABC-2 type transport system ATP-binding protein [Enterococcus sp. PF1-24]|uniref:ABC transporter ATP-binding protein n=1 Tax=unclassified Enterococcus TaxID=2608891 RepID=UPI002476DDD3|nr:MULTISPECIES: ABC transporter ATP-binding protein [unclassified Enterococcus]MDH6364104.1 ABC-2 type transport system ATP-binding protein [Enterococcus sp. PFB1-1]MDH6401205.1 ABC-2 type transport system ATP-binding protein [Enterococcus sp. PF1-24]